VIVNLSNNFVQTNVTDRLRGRVMGIFTFTFFGLMPIGSLLNGYIADQIGAPLTIQINAIVLVIAAFVLFIGFPFVKNQV
jgi:MFS family permease